MTTKIFSLLTTALLTACGSRPDPVASSITADESDEAIELEIISSLESEGRFRLSNQTSRPIAFHSTQQDSDGAHAQDARLSCKPADSEQWDQGPRPMTDSPATLIEVAPGSQHTVIVLWEPGLTEHYAGGSCRVDLRLQDGSVIASSEFSL